MKIRSTALWAVIIYTSAALSIFAVFAYVFAIALYLLYPNYLDHVQATVASVSWLWMQGHELYPNWATGEIYGLIYGPVLFLINGMALLLSQSIFASKLPGVLSLGAALGATWMLLRWKTASSLTSLILLASLIMLFAAFDEFVYWNRAEPFLILLSVLALWLAFRSSSLVAGVGIGVLTGVATGLKIHGFIYTVPAVAAALARIEVPRNRTIMAIIASACALAFALLPYLEKGVSIIGYLRFLRMGVDEGFLVYQFIENVLFAVILTAPIIVVWIVRKPALNPSERWLLAALGASLALITVIGAKAGGGTYYLLPLAPICIYAIAIVCASSKTDVAKVASCVFVSYLFASLGLPLLPFWNPPNSPNIVLNIGHLYRLEATAEQEKIAELKTYLDAYPEAQIGITDYGHYSSYFYRVFSVWNGRPLDIDFSVWMDLAYVGVDEGYILRFIKGCAIPVWIFPLGRPFTMINWYNGLPLLSESFRRTFFTNYRQIEAGQAYQVWKCKS
jgi:hypothetical protein